MASVRWALMPAVLLFAALTLAGCPAGPRLVVTPLALVINADKDATQFQIGNIGTANLAWTASTSAPWLSLSAVAPGAAKDGASLSGTLSTGLAGVRVPKPQTRAIHPKPPGLGKLPWDSISALDLRVPDPIPGAADDGAEPTQMKYITWACTS
mgnify:CR=1 FL=1